MKAWSVSQDSKGKLALSRGKSTVYIYGNPVRYHRDSGADWTRYVIGSDANSKRIVMVSSTDAASLSLLNRLPPADDPEGVERLLNEAESHLKAVSEELTFMGASEFSGV